MWNPQGVITWDWQTPHDGVRRTELETPVEPSVLMEAVDTELAAGARRVEVLLDPSRRDLRRLTMRAGLRTEGTLRAFAGDSPQGDRLLTSRVATDPPRLSREGRLGVLDSSLPVKRVIAQAVITDGQGRVLLCELTYKPEWDLPGGVVDPHESPAHAVVRELDEELGVKATLTGLRVVSWLPPWRGWDDAMLYLFDVELDALLLLEAAEAAARDGGVVNEHVLALVIGSNEAEALLAVEPLHGTGGHRMVSMPSATRTARA